MLRKLLSNEGTSAISQRWRQVPYPLINHSALGAIYAWSLIAPSLMRINGVVAPASHDWVASDVNVTFSLVMGGFAFGAVLSKHLDKWGVNKSCLLGAGCLGGGFVLASQAVSLHSLPLLYVGGGVWGLANGLAYTPPISTLTKWFPERKGLASSLCLVGYGAGALVAAPLIQNLLKYFAKLPTYVGSVVDGSVKIIYQNGKPFVNMAGIDAVPDVSALKEVVLVGQSALPIGSFPNLAEGAYLVGTGNTGIGETLAALGLLYGSLMAFSATRFKTPPPDYHIPTPSVPSNESSSSPTSKKETASPLTNFNVALEDTTLTKQFVTLYLGFGISAAGSLAYISSSAIVLNDTFAKFYPDIVSPAFIASYVGLTSIANLSGRLGWGYLSDILARRHSDPFYGRKQTYNILWGTAPLFWIGILWGTGNAALATSPSAGILGGNVPLAAFCLSSFGLCASYGGSTALRPAIIGDLFGLKNMTAIVARQLSVVLPAAFAGPYIFASCKEASARRAAHELADKIDPNKFESVFGASRDQIDLLFQTKSVTIPRLMEYVPAGTPDPTPFLYHEGLMIFASFQLLALLSNIILTPVDPSLHEKQKVEEKK